MKRIKYILRVLSGVKIKKIFELINYVHKKTNKNKILIFLDIVLCSIRYGAAFSDYKTYEFYNMNHNQRKTYVTRMSNSKIINMCNDPAYTYIFDNKSEFNKRFKKYLNREYLDLKNITFEKFKTFMKDKTFVFAKPNVGESGKGIERLDKSKFKDLNDMYSYVISKEKNFGVIEELIVQHKVFSKLYPLAINTLRIVTIVADGKPYVVYMVSKIGNEGKYVDNMRNSGLCCPVDLETGKISGIAHCVKLINYDKHPYTGVKFVGYQLVYIKEAIELVKKAALEIPQIKYVGWDVAITEKGPVIIEGNNYPGYDFWQLPEHTPNKTGLLPFFKKLLPKL